MDLSLVVPQNVAQIHERVDILNARLIQRYEQMGLSKVEERQMKSEHMNPRFWEQMNLHSLVTIGVDMDDGVLDVWFAPYEQWKQERRGRQRPRA